MFNLPKEYYQSFEASVTIPKETSKHEFGHSSQPYSRLIFGGKHAIIQTEGTVARYAIEQHFFVVSEIW